MLYVWGMKATTYVWCRVRQALHNLTGIKRELRLQVASSGVGVVVTAGVLVLVVVVTTVVLAIFVVVGVCAVVLVVVALVLVVGVIAIAVDLLDILAVVIAACRVGAKSTSNYILM